MGEGVTVAVSDIVFTSRRRHTRFDCDWSSDVCSSDLRPPGADAVSVSASQPTVVVTGNPNVGKSVIFQLLTGRYTTVSNYPGTTVMVARGGAVVEGRRVAVCDTPGLNSLQAASEDERKSTRL